MKKIFYLFALVVFALTSCDKTEINTENLDAVNSQTDNINRGIRPIKLGGQLNNPYSVENMIAALDSLKANPDSLSGCMKAPSTLNDIEITATDLYVRFLPQDSVQYRTLMNDTTLSLFDFPLDYEIKQTGDYYKDPTISGDYTWLYTRVPVGYTPPAGIKYEVIENLFILEHSPYYSVETVSQDSSIMKAKSEYGRNLNEALRVLQAVSFYITGNLKQDSKAKNHFTNTTPGMQKAKSYLTVKIFGRTITLATFYFPSGYLKGKGYHTMNNNGGVSSSTASTDVPLKGIKMHFLSWFTWNSVYTDENGYYQSNQSYLLDPIHTIYFSGKNGNNSWDLDRVWLWGSCLWVQKYSLGVQSKDNYDAVIDTTSDAWDACTTNNAFYEYMTICDKEGMSRPPAHLQIALRVKSGSSSAPLFQNHTNTYTALFLGGFFNYVYSYTTDGSSFDAANIPASMFLNSLPDILLSGGDIKKLETDKSWALSQKDALSKYYSTIWHELSHSSDFQQMKNDKGYGTASSFWTSLVGTEGGHSIATFGGGSYGSKGDSNWEQVALCEGWAYYRGWTLAEKYLYYGSYKDNKTDFPRNFYNMFNALKSFGCSDANMEKCLNVKTFSEFKQQLKNIYSANKTLCNNIEERINYFYN